MGFKPPELKDRRSAAETAKKAMLEKFRSALHDPARDEQREKRLAAHEARLIRMAEREAAKKQAAREAEEAKIRIAAEEAERAAALKAAQIAERDARLAERNAAKKVRKRGY